MIKTIKQQIQELLWYNLPNKLKPILLSFLTAEDVQRQIISTSDLSFTIVPTSSTIMLTLLEGNEEVVLPPVENNAGTIIFITNDTGNDVTMLSSDGELSTWNGGVLENSSTIATGSVLRVINDSLSWKIL